VNAEQLLIESLTSLAAKAKANGVCLVLENHPRDLRNPGDAQKLLRVVEQFPRETVALCLDNGHIEPQVWLECVNLLLPQTRHCHAKFYAFDTAGEESEINYAAFFDAVRRSEYRGSFSIEVISPDTCKPSLARLVLDDESFALLKEDGVRAEALTSLRAIQAKCSDGASAFQRAVQNCLGLSSRPEEVQAIVKRARTLDVCFEENLQLTCKAVQLLTRFTGNAI
jgi:sugar phosphate isomerase/epimerase